MKLMNNEPIEVQKLLKQLLKKIDKVDFRELAGEDAEGDLRLTNRHYLVYTIDRLLVVAIENDWGLCRNNDFIYLYNGEFWNVVDSSDFKYFLGRAAFKMGVNKTESKYYVFQDNLLKQFFASARLPFPSKEKDTVLINLKNGTYEVTPNGGMLREFRRKDFLIYQLPFEFDPSATAPLFHKYLNRVLPDKNLQDVLSEYLGYVFTRHLKLEKCLLLYGSGANGKSVFFEIVNALLGKENVSNFSLGNLSEEHNRALIANKLLNYGSEIRGNIESDVFKQLVSGEPIQCRMKYGNSFFIEDYARLCFNCNELPKDVEHTEAYFRRFTIIPLKVTIPEHERDPELAKKIIQTELSGVFNWVLEGINRLLEQKGFTFSDTIKATINEFKQQSDSVHLFLAEEGYSRSTDACSLLKHIYPEYRNFCTNDGYRSLSKSNFKKRLENLGYVVERKNIGMTVFLKKAA
jgi:putative DNA primase/helicase